MPLFVKFIIGAAILIAGWYFLGFLFKVVVAGVIAWILYQAYQALFNNGKAHPNDEG